MERISLSDSSPQPFLTPLPPSDSNVVLNITLPLRYLLGALRTGIVIVLAGLYAVLVEGICLILVSRCHHCDAQDSNAENLPSASNPSSS